MASGIQTHDIAVREPDKTHGKFCGVFYDEGILIGDDTPNIKAVGHAVSDFSNLVIAVEALADGELADEVGALEARIDALKAEAIRRNLRRAEGAQFRITLTPPGISQRMDKPKLLSVLGITAAEFTTRFCHPVQSGWRMTVTAIRKYASAA